VFDRESFTEVGEGEGAMSLFASNEKEYGKLLIDINKRANEIPDLKGEEKQKEIDAGHHDVDEALELLEQMDVSTTCLQMMKVKGGG
jgi:hypothetical protein